MKCLMLMGAPLLALALSSPAAAGPWVADPERPVDWKTPVSYTAGGLGLQLLALVASGEADSSPSLENFGAAWQSGPRPDDDSAVYNFLLHPLWGSETYLRARESNLGIAGSFGFSLAASATWEYVFESWTEHPSSQDLVFTTGIGWMLGELRYQLKQRLDGSRHWWVDPIHASLEHWGLAMDADDRPRLVFSHRF